MIKFGSLSPRSSVEKRWRFRNEPWDRAILMSDSPTGPFDIDEKRRAKVTSKSPCKRVLSNPHLGYFSSGRVSPILFFSQNKAKLARFRSTLRTCPWYETPRVSSVSSSSR